MSFTFGDGFWGSTGKQVVKLVAQKQTVHLVGSRKVFICPRDKDLEALGLRSPLAYLQHPPCQEPTIELLTFLEELKKRNFRVYTPFL